MTEQEEASGVTFGARHAVVHEVVIHVISLAPGPPSEFLLTAFFA